MNDIRQEIEMAYSKFRLAYVRVSVGAWKQDKEEPVHIWHGRVVSVEFPTVCKTAEEIKKWPPASVKNKKSQFSQKLRKRKFFFSCCTLNLNLNIDHKKA